MRVVSLIVGFVIGLVVGMFVGVAVIALCSAGKQEPPKCDHDEDL